MSNQEIIALEASKKGYNYNGSNIKTYGEWINSGYQVEQGQRAFIKVYLWTNGVNRRKTLQGLFTLEQVTKITSKDLIMV